MRTVRLLWGQRLRQDRVQLPVWLVGLALLAYSGRVGVTQSYGDAQERATLVVTAIGNRVILLFRGLPSGSGQASLTAFLILGYLVMLAGFMCTLLAVRHTRAEEDSGRAELVGGTPVGRTAPLVATVLHGVACALAAGIVVALVYVACGMPAAGSVLVGAAVAAGAAVFLAVALVAAQVCPTSRPANAVATVAVLGTFVLAGLGNVFGTPDAGLTRITSAWPAWLSPFGWSENTRAFDADRWWPLVPSVVVTAALVWLALWLAGRRDLGAALVPAGRGRAAARSGLRGPLTLAVRLTWGSVVAWSVGALLTGALTTGLAPLIQQAGDSVGSLRTLLQAMAGNTSLEQGAVVIFFTMIGALAGCCAVQVVVRARQEEAAGRAEPLWAAAVGRRRWLGAQLLVAAGGVIVTMAAAVVGAGLGLASSPDATLWEDVLVTGAGQALAAGVFLALAALLVTVLPRASVALSWVLVILGLAIGLFGPLLGLPDAVVHASPFGVAPTLHGGEVAPNGALWLALVVVVGVGLSLLLVRRRPLVAG